MNLFAASLCLGLLLAGASCSQKKQEKRADPPAPVINASLARAKQATIVFPQTMVLRQVLLETGDPAKAYALHTQELAKGLGVTLVTSGWVAAREREVPDDHMARPVEAMLNVSYDVTLPSKNATGMVVVAIEAALEFVNNRSELQPRVALIVEKALTSSDEHDIARELNWVARSALDSAAESLVARERLRRAPHEELLSVLSMGELDVGMEIWALQLAADRFLLEAVPAAMKALAYPDDDVRAAAISALVSLGDPRAVSALSRDIDFKDHQELRVIMEAVSAIGGDDAIEFLEYVASGHPDDDLRARAKESIQHARRRDPVP